MCSSIGAVAALMPLALLPVLLVWLLLVTTTGYVGLATICAAAALPFYVLFTLTPARLLVVAAGLGTWSWMRRKAFTTSGFPTSARPRAPSRSNIARLRTGTENRMERLMLRRPRGSSP